MNEQMALEAARGMMDSGMSAADANVELVRMRGHVIIKGRMTKDVRAALNNAVKNGRLGHLKKEGLRPEAYFHPNSAWRAKEARDAEFNRGVRAILAACG